ncbi:GAK8 protein, partial [Locustella ochotensis]|nr:GAK8 protein [Locustella ochotensis]
MDRQVAYDLFISMLQKRGIRGIDLQKELPGLLAYGYAKGCFANPHTVHELSEWRKLGDILWDAMIDGDKTAKKLGTLWRVAHNELLQIVAEKKAAEKAIEAHKNNIGYGQEGEPAAPAITRVVLPPVMPTAGQIYGNDGKWPSAPPVADEEDEESPSLPNSTPQTTAPRISGGDQGPAPRPLRTPDPIPGSLSDLWGEMARQRREVWSNLAKEALRDGDSEMLEAAGDMTSSGAFAFSVTFQYEEVDAQVGVDALGNPQMQRQQRHAGQYQPLDWKWLSQLRQTVSQFGIKSKPVKQMLDYLFNSHLLLPVDLRGIAKLLFTQHQQLLFNAHWQQLVNEAVAVQRGPGDPLHGITMDELLGIGPYIRAEAQMTMGPDKVREAMQLVRLAIDRVKEPGGQPIYMGIKQGREETFGAFIDRVAAAIERAGVPDYMKGALLKQCAMQNASPAIQRMISTMGGDWTIEQALERAATMPTGPHAFLVRAIEKLGEGLQKQAEATQSQVLAALAPLQALAITGQGTQPHPSARCYRCGGGGHFRKTCRATGVWCQTCQSPTHNTRACRRRPSGNSRKSAGGRAQTQVAAGRAPPAFNP